MPKQFGLFRLGKTFLLIWLGQLVSLVGTSMMRFAYILWAYEKDGTATTVAMLGFAAFVLDILLSPVAGVIVDRRDRRLIMLLADVCAGLTIGVTLVLHLGNSLQIWHLYIAEAVLGACDAFQLPAFSAATTMLIPKDQYARASGMRSFAASASQFCAPFLAGALLALIHLSGVMVVDILTYVFSIGTLLMVVVPRPDQRHHSDAEGFWKQLSFGFRYVARQRGLRLLLGYFVLINFAAYLTWFSVLAPLVLARTNADQFALATVQTAMGVGGVIGGLVISVWGGPRRQIHNVLLFTAISFLLGDFVLAIARSVPFWALGGFLGSFFIPFIVAADRAIWQKRVPPAIQGRVFGAKGAFQVTMAPLGMALGGLLADHFFEPAMQPGGLLAPAFGWLVGTGHGHGMALMFVLTALMGITLGLGGYLIPALRNVEEGPHEPETVATPSLAEIEQPLHVN
jgi:DHA3 family macrolide efflux protein-like MFS transporter